MDKIKELLGEELYKQVAEKLGDKKLIVNDGNYIPKDKFNALNEENKSLKTEITTRDNQLNELKSKAAGNDDLTRKIEELTNLNNTTKQEYETKIKDITLNSAIETALSKSNAKFSDLLSGKIDKSKIVVDNDKIIGLDEQIASLKENYKDLFTTKVTGNEPAAGGTSGDNSQAWNGMDLGFMDNL